MDNFLLIYVGLGCGFLARLILLFGEQLLNDDSCVSPTVTSKIFLDFVSFILNNLDSVGSFLFLLRVGFNDLSVSECKILNGIIQFIYITCGLAFFESNKFISVL